MDFNLFEWVLQIPRVIANFGNWLTTPISSQYLNISPLGLLGVAGTSFLVAIIVVHVVRLFV